MKKLNSLGITHLLIPLIVVIVGVAAVGTYMLVSGSAARYVGVGVVGKADVKRVISNTGKAHVITDLQATVSSSKGLNNVTVTIGGKKAKLQKCIRGGNICYYAVRVSGKQNEKHFKTKASVNGKTKDAQSTYYTSVPQ